MRSRIPSTQALRALECFARHGTVWGAADEMNLTRSAVSHQLRLLERELGLRLFERAGNRITLTPRGRAFAEDVRAALSSIAGSAARNAESGLSGVLTVSCTPGFAATWLAAKLAGFTARHPNVGLRIVTPRQLDDVSNPEVDVFIAFGDVTFPGADITCLKSVAFTPMVSPGLANRLGGLQEPADVLRAPLLHLGDHADWRDRLDEAGVAEAVPETGPVFADMNLVYAAAMNGQGIAMGDEFILSEPMRSGQLVRPFELTIRSPKSYYLVIPPSKTALGLCRAFRRWLVEQLRGVEEG
jgi:LysR family glycine cleavage system transcriptional activator